MKSLRCTLGLHDMSEWVRDGYVYRSKCSQCPHEHIRMVSRKVIEAELTVNLVKILGEYLIDRAMDQQRLKRQLGKALEKDRDDWR